MTEDHDEIRDVGDIPEYEANELREIVRKVLDNHIDELIDRYIDEFVDTFVVSVYRDLHRPLTSSAFNPLFQEEIPQEEKNAFAEEGFNEYLSGRELDEVDEDKATEYALYYALVAVSMHYPWLMARRDREP